MTVLAGNGEEQMDDGEEEYEDDQEEGDEYGDNQHSEPDQAWVPQKWTFIKQLILILVSFTKFQV